MLFGATPESNSSAPCIHYLYVVGFLFPILGVLYREFTILTIDHADHGDIESRLGSGGRNDYRHSRRRIEEFGLLRGIVLRMLLLAPSFLWSLAIVDKYASHTAVFILTTQQTAGLNLFLFFVETLLLSELEWVVRGKPQITRAVQRFIRYVRTKTRSSK